ncbi:hypothetical protein D3C80_1384870 [compost metagenome]
MVDIQAVLGGNGADPLQLLGRHLAGQQGHDMPRLALAADPLLVIRLGHRGEAHLLVELVGGEQQILEHRGALFGRRNLNQNAEGQGVVDHRLADIEDIHPALGQHTGNCGSQTGTVFAGNIDQDDFAQGAPSGARLMVNRLLAEQACGKAAHSTHFRGHTDTRGALPYAERSLYCATPTVDKSRAL